MPVKIGIVGLGFMGKMHFDTYQSIRGAKVTAICDIDPKKRRGEWGSIGGNIAGKGGLADLSGIQTFSKIDAMLEKADIDVVDITLPTYLHAENTVKALKAGYHVFCEKPMALNSKEAKLMADTAAACRRRLFVGHCIRFWPMYEKAREIVRAKECGPVVSATFRRVSPIVLWGWKNWLQQADKSGLAALDLHIHDADFILHTFGKPRAVTSAASGLKPGRNDHIVTMYDYGKNRLVTAEGAWEHAPGFPFSMSFVIHMRDATLMSEADLSLSLIPVKGGKAQSIRLPKGDGYQRELAHFVDCIAEGKASDVVSPRSAVKSVRLIEAEVQSAMTGKKVPVKF